MKNILVSNLGNKREKFIALMSLAVLLGGSGMAETPKPAHVSGTVPIPWTPLEADGQRVKCWGRENVIQGPFPQQIVSQGEKLLAGPVVFRFQGQAEEPPVAPPVWSNGNLTKSGRAVEWAASATRDDVKMSARTSIEYDGFWDISVDLGAGVFKGLVLEIPLVSSHIKFLHFVNETHYQETNTLELPAADGEVWSHGFNCGVWLGDDDVGLQWVADSDEFLRLENPQRACVIQRSGAVTTLRITLIDHEVVLKKPLRWRFGLVATPIRPMSSPKWRDWRMSPGASANVHIWWWQAWTASHADTVPKDPQALAQQATALAAKGQYLLPYVSMLSFTGNSQAYTQGDGSHWRREPLLDSAPDGDSPRHWIMCPNNGWCDFFPGQMEKLFEVAKVNGLYYDFVFPWTCNAAHHPCGYEDDQGARRSEFQIFKMRQIAQATYEGVKAVRADSLIMLHISDSLLYSCIGFGDLMLVGEEKRLHPTQSVVRAQGHYMDVLPLAELRAEYRGHQAGLAPFIIPELATLEGMPDPELCEKPGPTVELLALTLLHDIGVWPIYCHEATVEKVRVAQRDFGIADAVFAPYWENQVPVELADKTLLASAWVKGAAGGTPAPSALIVITNRGDKDIATGAKFNGKAVDALTNEALAGATLTVPARAFRLIKVSQ